MRTTMSGEEKVGRRTNTVILTQKNLTKFFGEAGSKCCRRRASRLLKKGSPRWGKCVQRTWRLQSSNDLNSDRSETRSESSGNRRVPVAEQRQGREVFLGRSHNKPIGKEGKRGAWPRKRGGESGTGATCTWGGKGWASRSLNRTGARGGTKGAYPWADCR